MDDCENIDEVEGTVRGGCRHRSTSGSYFYASLRRLSDRANTRRTIS